MFKHFDPADDEPVSLGIGAAEKRKQILKDEKNYQNLKSSRKVDLFRLWLSIGVLVFASVLSAESLVVNGLLPGRAVKSVVVTRKTSEPIKNSNHRLYYVYWMEPDSETEQKEPLSLNYDDWSTIKDNQKIELVGQPFYDDWIILGTSKTSGIDLAIKLSTSVLCGCGIFYLLRKLKIVKQEILEIERSKFKVNF